MVGDTGIEPVTPSMSTKCSPAELIAHPMRGAGCLASCASKRKIGLRTKTRHLQLSAKHENARRLAGAVDPLIDSARPP